MSIEDTTWCPEHCVKDSYLEVGANFLQNGMKYPTMNSYGLKCCRWLEYAVSSILMYFDPAVLFDPECNSNAMEVVRILKAFTVIAPIRFAVED